MVDRREPGALARASFNPAARRELDAAADFYADEAPGLGDAFLDELERAVGWALDHPQAGAPLGGPFRRWLVRRFPYAVIYRADREPIRVLAVAHLRRRPGYWRGRG